MLLHSVPWLRAQQRAAAAWLLAALAACGGGGGGSTSVDTPVVVTTPTTPTTPTAPTSAASAATASLQVDWPPVPFDVSPEFPFDIGLFAIGGVGKETWAVKCSPHITCNIVEGNRLMVTSAADPQAVEAAITLTVTDSRGAQGSLTVPIMAWPKTRNVTTLVGAPDRPGIHLLIMGDGFLPQDMGLFRDAAAGVVKEMFSRPEIAAHKDAWNVHMVELAVLDDVTGQPKASPLGAKLGCHGTLSPVICYEEGQVKRAALAHLPYYSSIVLIVNSTKIGGSAANDIAALTRQPKSAMVAVHEMGHAFAGLADEYVERNSTPTQTFDAPNLTLETDRHKIPWRHWIAADTPLPSPLNATTMAPNFVGLFEGGGYVSTGIYRPTYESLMSDETKPMGPVNGEAWARSVYAKGGAWRRVAPAANATLTRDAQPAGGWLFEAQPLLDRAIAETRWYVDGVERTDQRGAGQLLLPATGAVQVRVDLIDLTGRVRLNDGVVNTLKWTVP